MNKTMACYEKKMRKKACNEKIEKEQNKKNGNVHKMRNEENERIVANYKQK